MVKVPFRSFSLRFLLLVSILAMAGCGWFSKNDPQSAAEAFFGLLGKGDTSAAYDSAAFVFQAQQSQQSFEVTVKELGLPGFKSINWTHVVATGNEAKLDAEIITKNGGSGTVKVTLVKESGQWKIYALHTPFMGATALAENRFSMVGRNPAFSRVFKKSLPAESEIKELVRESLLKFSEAIKKKSFAEFYLCISNKWQVQISEKRLENAFAGFLEGGIDISSVQSANIVFDAPPLINNEGVLVVGGHFQVPPYQVVFSLKYIYEFPKWRLFGIDVNCLK